MNPLLTLGEFYATAAVSLPQENPKLDLLIQAERIMSTIKFCQFQLISAKAFPDYYSRIEPVIQAQFDQLCPVVSKLYRQAAETENYWIGSKPLLTRACEVQRELVALQVIIETKGVEQTTSQHAVSLAWDFVKKPHIPLPFLLTKKTPPSEPKICWGAGLHCLTEQPKTTPETATTNDEADLNSHHFIIHFQLIAFSIQKLVDSISILRAKVYYEKNCGPTDIAQTKIDIEKIEAESTLLSSSLKSYMTRLSDSLIGLNPFDGTDIRATLLFNVRLLVTIHLITRTTALEALIENRMSRLQSSLGK